MCVTKTYFPAGKKPKEKAGTITCVNALYEIKRFNFSIIVPPFIRIYAISLAGALSRNRTSDTRIFSPLLYQLSYLGISKTFLFLRVAGTGFEPMTFGL